MSVVRISERTTLIDSEDKQDELHFACLCIKEVSDFKIRYSSTTGKNSSPTLIELLLASEEIVDAGSGMYFKSVRLFDAKTKRKTEWNVNKISNKLPRPTTEWHFELEGNIRPEIEFTFNFAMISKNRPEGKFEFKVEDEEWKEISKPSQDSTARILSSARQEWVQNQLDIIIGRDEASNPFFHPKQEATSRAIKDHVESDIRHITYVGLDDAANFFSSIFGLSKKGVELKDLQVSLRYAKRFDVNTETTWLKEHPRVQYTDIKSSIHTEPWVKTDLIIDTYTIGEWFDEATIEQYQERFEEEITCRQEALNSDGKIILVYPTKPTPLCEAPDNSVLEFFDNPNLMKKLGLKVIEKITKVGAAKGFVLKKIESDRDMLSKPDSTLYMEAEPLTPMSEGLQVVSDFNGLREVIDRRSRRIEYHMEANHPNLQELVDDLTKRLYQHEGPNIIVVAGPPGIRKTTMVASALLPNDTWPQWSGKRQPSILVGTPMAAWNRRTKTDAVERRILFLDDLQDQLDDIRNIHLHENGKPASDLEATQYFLRNLTGYAAVIVTWRSEKEGDEDYFYDLDGVKCIDMHIYGDHAGEGSADSQANRYIKQHFKGNWVDVLSKKDPKKFDDWIKEIKECLILIFSDPNYRCLESYAGAAELKKNLQAQIRRIRRQSSDLDPFQSPTVELKQMLAQINDDPFAQSGVGN